MKSVSQNFYRGSPQHRQKGIALLTVLLILAVMVIVASNMASRLQLELRRTSNIVTHEQAQWYALAAEELVEKALKQTLKDDKTINLDQYWALEGMMYPVENGQIGGQVFDLRACFNVNAVVGNDDAKGHAPTAVRQFRNLLEQLDIEAYEAEQISDALRDWIDPDTNVITSYGAEDAYYESLTFPYQAGNQMLLDTTELRAVKGVTKGIYQRIRPYVCALPTNKLKINVNTVAKDKPEILASLFLGQVSLDQVKTILEERPSSGWENVNDFFSLPELTGLKLTNDQKDVFDIKSEYFSAHLLADFDTASVKLESLFKAESEKKVYVIRRQFGGAQ